MEQYFNYNINEKHIFNEYDEFSNLYDFNTPNYQKANNKYRLKVDYANKKPTPLVRAFLVYLKMKSDNVNRIDDTPLKDSDESSDESSDDTEGDDEEQIVEPVKEEVKKPLKPLIERALGTIQVFKLHGKAYPDEFNKVNDDDLSVDEKNNIASKILNYKIY
jgi:hypothetical protein